MLPLSLGADQSVDLVAAGLILSTVAFAAFAVLFVVAVSAAFGAQAPLLAAVPTASAALFVVQLLALVGQDDHSPQPLVDLCKLLTWASPESPLVALALSIAALAATSLARGLAVCRHVTANGAGSGNALPHGLTLGAWELRALSFVALPLAASTTRLAFLYDTPLLGWFVACTVMLSMGKVASIAWRLANEVVENGDVVRAELPLTAGGGEVFVDRVCDQLRALPMCARSSGCPGMLNDWLSTPSWCASPTVAVIREVQHEGSPSRVVGGAGPDWPSTPWCSNEDAIRASVADADDEISGRPLLKGSSRNAVSNLAGEDAEMALRCDSAVAGMKFDPIAARPSVVCMLHPVLVTATYSYDPRGDTHDLVAGVACLPWLDCAVPAAALRRLEELSADVVFRVQCAQLSGPITGGRFAALFDWGTCWPWRWPVEVTVKTAIGVWVAAPLHAASDGSALAGIAAAAHFSVLAFIGALGYGILALRPYEHAADNAAASAALFATVLAIALRGLGDSVPDGTAHAAAAAAVVLMAVPLLLTLIAALALGGAMLGRLQAQGLHDRLLHRTVAGWGSFSRLGVSQGTDMPDDHSEVDLDSLAGDDFGGLGPCGATGSRATGAGKMGNHAVEITLPGLQPSSSITLPAETRPRVVQAQLLPLGADSSGSIADDAGAAVGERARLPLPPTLFFPSAQRDTADASACIPLAALLAPGRPGKLVHAEASQNEGGRDWRESIRDFFGPDGERLAEQAESMVDRHALPGSRSEVNRVMAVIEVLPAFAVEYTEDAAMDYAREVHSTDAVDDGFE